ncbi:5-oxoprolinase subunit PxpB [Marinobacter caseinilyticus]|uniref:5-oxoprolinase subunit PxpB n=1 Tax=Marinobacter caseinilyticus TaxID=2692195 RepID=UPI001A945C8E|nr:5-oxoprolinase subunit PxpB [Marinobacter caseinilyticus]
MKIEAINENTCIVYLGDEIHEAIAEKVKQAVVSIRRSMADVVLDLVPSYTSVMVCFDLTKTDRFAMASRLRQALGEPVAESEQPGTARTIELPVYYAPEVGLDLDDVCQASGLPMEDVVNLHTGCEYRVYAIGFSPGFAYLGSTDDRIAVPRKSTPRLKVPTGSVGIAGTQTAIYPSSTPGGWQIVGRTPSKMIDWNSESLALMQVGDRVRFRSIDRQEYIDLGGTFDEL